MEKKTEKINDILNEYIEDEEELSDVVHQIAEAVFSKPKPKQKKEPIELVTREEKEAQRLIDVHKQEITQLQKELKELLKSELKKIKISI